MPAITIQLALPTKPMRQSALFMSLAPHPNLTILFETAADSTYGFLESNDHTIWCPIHED